MISVNLQDLVLKINFFEIIKISVKFKISKVFWNLPLIVRIIIKILKKYQDHIVCSYGYTLRCVDEQYSKPYKS